MIPAAAPARILLVEDEEQVRRRLVRVIETSEGFALLGAAANLAEARELLDMHEPDALLVDLGLPDGRGTELIREALARYPESHVMVITVFGDEAHVIEAVEAGASAYLLKDSSTTHIARAIREMLDGGSPISASVARYLLRRFRQPARSEPDPEASSGLVEPEATPFSQRETEVLHLVARGLSYADIAERLGISINTVGTHAKQIYRKLAVNSRGEAVFQAQARGLIPSTGG